MARKHRNRVFAKMTISKAVQTSSGPLAPMLGGRPRSPEYPRTSATAMWLTVSAPTTRRAHRQALWPRPIATRRWLKVTTVTTDAAATLRPRSSGAKYRAGGQIRIVNSTQKTGNHTRFGRPRKIPTPLAHMPWERLSSKFEQKSASGEAAAISTL